MWPITVLFCRVTLHSNTDWNLVLRILWEQWRVFILSGDSHREGLSLHSSVRNTTLSTAEKKCAPWYPRRLSSKTTFGRKKKQEKPPIKSYRKLVKQRRVVCRLKPAEQINLKHIPINPQWKNKNKNNFKTGEIRWNLFFIMVVISWGPANSCLVKPLIDRCLKFIETK